MEQVIASECPEGEAWSFVGSKQCELTNVDEARALFQREAQSIICVALSGSPVFFQTQLYITSRNMQVMYIV